MPGVERVGDQVASAACPHAHPRAELDRRELRDPRGARTTQPDRSLGARQHPPWPVGLRELVAAAEVGVVRGQPEDLTASLERGEPDRLDGIQRLLDIALPDTALIDIALPDIALLDTALPDTALPDIALPDTALLDTALLNTVLFEAVLFKAVLPGQPVHTPDPTRAHRQFPGPNPLGAIGEARPFVAVAGCSSMNDEVSVVPANHARCEDLQAVLGERGPASRCQCQRYKLEPRETFASVSAETRADRLRGQTGCGQPGSTATSGLVAYMFEAPVGWCAIEPRSRYEGLIRVYKVPWAGRDEDRDDDSVWSVTCLVTRVGFRRRGVSRALAIAAVEFARGRGARAVEGYPMATSAAIAEELHVGTVDTFAAAGFREVARPTPRRVVMRVDFS